MLKEIVQLILEGGMKSKQEIAKAIGIQMETLEDMLLLLVKRGVLSITECQSMDTPACSSCPTAKKGCSSDFLGQTYYVTEKGKKYAKT
ncbi:MAG: FeoC-like transcriptional regulator [Candidatus Thorarchaeota archaeon]|nr:FeoC-like transcriptional regulator [Candidatus Thorarchaeota archaeon]